jgi:hypothetical protein
MRYRVRIPGDGGRIEARAARVHAAVPAQLARLEKPKPNKPAQKTFAHIRDYRDAGR